MGASQRRKGAAGEREWCAWLETQGEGKVKRALGQARDGGGDVPHPPFLFEVKRHARFAVYEHIKQAIAAAPQYPGCEIPTVALRGDGEEWLVVLRASDFIELVRQTRGVTAGLKDLL